MTTTVAQLIEETRRLLYGSSRLSLNRLPASGSGVLVADTQLTLEFDLLDATRGALISIDDELMWVVSQASVASKQISVVRGYLGTTPANHAAGSIVEVNPRFPRIYIKRALQQEIDSWGTKLFKVSTANIAFSQTSRIYDLGFTNFIQVFDVRVSPFLGRTTRSNPYRWSVLRDLDPVDFPSGSAIELLGDYPNSGTMRLKFTQKFDVSVWTDTTDVEAIGLTTSMCAIPPVGAAWRLMSAKEVGRTNLTAQPEPRLAQEVPAGHMASAAQQLKTLRDNLIDEERWTLMNRYPLKGVA